MDVAFDVRITLDGRFFGGADEETISKFADKVDSIQGVVAVDVADDEVTAHFEDMLPGDAKRALIRCIKRNPI